MEALQEVRELCALIVKKIEILEKKVSSQDTYSYSSPELKNLFSALSKAQGTYKPVICRRENPYFKTLYEDLDEIMNAVRPSLEKNGLSFIQQIKINDEGQTMLHSILGHASGEWIESRLRIVPSKNDVQTFRSTLASLKRDAALALLGVTVKDDHYDDDGERAVYADRDVIAKGVALNTKYNPKEQTYETVTKEQLDELHYELSEYPDITEQVLEGLKIQSLSDMPKSKFLVSINRVREIKNNRNGKK